MSSRIRGQARGIRYRPMEASDQRGRAMEAIEKESHAVGAGEDEPIECAKLCDGGVGGAPIGRRAYFDRWLHEHIGAEV